MVDRIRPLLPILLTRKAEGHEELVDQLAEELEASSHCADVALFGRMIEVADTTPFGKRNLRVDAACQVAHALSSHQVNPDFDYFTAVDDLNPQGVTGAGMIGTVEFNSACFYRYANIDLGQLEDNLGGDGVLARATARAFLYASRDAIPTGKQNSFAARNLPAFAFAVVRPAGFWSLANAFVQPVRASATSDIVQESVLALNRHWGDMAAMYGAPGGTLAVCALGSLQVPDPLGQARVDSYDALVQRVMAAIEV
jgi:CRISPR system Cascade subunit CasC